ncbi:hypothetical protein FBZ94_10251 [Bradyrhizobium sacchari]|uniref:Uncharacterized protein n=1 Tax=Bradyrhizobium sacchari TaxID=1399419 RepID=A0A560KFX3_9BRAD|nr:hypothetical protein FBZ94_10251 [Bradyrhizobium sacchari]TWB80834.1 hypothetical protein FBZ95_10251 [Bradyrhizobium sacchari]
MEHAELLRFRIKLLHLMLANLRNGQLVMQEIKSKQD